jgi:hypothetical protein
MTNDKWLIWSNEHRAWWRPNGNGYCTLRKEAGRYTYEVALEIVQNANYRLEHEPHEAMVLDVDINAIPEQ